MGLIIKPPSWGSCTTNLAGTPVANTYGVAFTPGVSNADGTAVTLLSALAHDVEYLVIGIEGTFLNTVATDCLLDILVDPAGGTSWSSFIDDLICGFAAAAQIFAPYPLFFHFPVWIPAGSSVGAQARTRATSVAGMGASCYIAAYGNNANPASWWCGQRVSSIGINAATSAGTAHTSGNSGSYSSWTDFGSTLGSACGALQFGTQPNTFSSLSSLTYFLEFGVASTRIGPNRLFTTSTQEDCWSLPNGLVFASLPTGSQLQVRGTCSGTAQAVQVGAYAVH